ncbi:glycosyltransferase family 2 protein [Lutibacter sp.]|uniref:glycosyltransferase family 2 protein n=1 Tax=Lutibacter sp. TaxID=1925666 RepID=UPI001A2DEC07|nr:glycosyltransferase family 2 protein [Lutibacter sp.]MBI9042225.1 glycosyltransferase family 2 protein [Lutibacter sp.]
MNDPLVSIITPNFNADKYISRSIESVLQQTYKNWELLIIDDGSTDNSVEIIEKFSAEDARIKLIKLSINSGPAICRNTGIEKASGSFIAFLDSDDYWDENKLAIQTKTMIEGRLSFSFTGYSIVNEANEFINIQKAKPLVSYNDLLTNNYIGCLTAMYSVTSLGKVYFPALLKRQDWALWLSITKKGVPAVGIDIPLAYYTKRRNSVSSNKFFLLKYNWIVYRKFENIKLLKSLKLMVILILKKILK